MKTILKIWSLMTLISMSQLSMAGITQPLVDKLVAENSQCAQEAACRLAQTLSSDPECLMGFSNAVTQVNSIAPHMTTDLKQAIGTVAVAEQVMTDHVAKTADISSQAIKSMTGCVEDVADVSKQAIGAITQTTKQVANQIGFNEIDDNSVGQVVDQTIQTSQGWFAYAQEKLLAGLNSQAGIVITNKIGMCASLANVFHRIAQYGRENQDDVLKQSKHRYTMYAKNWFLAGMSGLSACVLQNQDLLETHPYLCAIPVAITALDIVLQKDKFYPYREHPKNTMLEMGKKRDEQNQFRMYCVHCNTACDISKISQNTLNNSTGTIGKSTVSCMACKNNRSNLIAERVIRYTAAAALAGVAYRLASK